LPIADCGFTIEKNKIRNPKSEIKKEFFKILTVELAQRELFTRKTGKRPVRIRYLTQINSQIAICGEME
jgi:hypothetical protein